MQFHNPKADVYIPDGVEETAALARTTHLGIAAHQDDLEIMGYHGIAACYGSPDQWFTGIVLTNGAGSPRTGIYAACTDLEMQEVRRREQRKAALVGEYACQIQLDYTSAAVKDPRHPGVIEDLLAIMRAARPGIVYLHNPADKHDTHVGAALRSIAALRALAPEFRPKQVYGCEVWRDLDWVPEEDQRPLPVSARPNLAAALLGVFDSQISGGKRYDLATAGRRMANATYLASHGIDVETALTLALDLTPLIEDPGLSVAAYMLGFVDKFRADIEGRIAKLGG